jgi:hypothetical protein
MCSPFSASGCFRMLPDASGTTPDAIMPAILAVWCGQKHTEMLTGVAGVERGLAGRVAKIQSVHRDTGGYPVGHVGWNASSPDALHVALGQGIADRVDGIESECAGAILYTTECVAIQAAQGTAIK